MPIVSDAAVPRRLTNRSPWTFAPSVRCHSRLRQDRRGQAHHNPDANAGAGLGGDIERWFIARGLPHFIERTQDEAVRGAWNRALPLLVVAYLAARLQRPRPGTLDVAAERAGRAVRVAVLIVTWAVSNRMRHRPTFARPQRVDNGELILFLVGPTIPVIAFGQFGDALQTVAFGIALLVLDLPLVVVRPRTDDPLGRPQRGRGPLTGLGPLVARALPLLLLFTTFLFINAEVWQVAGTLDGMPYVAVILIFFGLGATFVLTRVPGYIRQENHFESWEESPRLVADTPADGVGLPLGAGDRRPAVDAPAASTSASSWCSVRRSRSRSSWWP